MKSCLGLLRSWKVTGHLNPRSDETRCSGSEIGRIWLYRKTRASKSFWYIEESVYGGFLTLGGFYWAIDIFLICMNPSAFWSKSAGLSQKRSQHRSFLTHQTRTLTVFWSLPASSSESRYLSLIEGTGKSSGGRARHFSRL